jgi:hypothetical protein
MDLKGDIIPTESDPSPGYPLLSHSVCVCDKIHSDSHLFYMYILKYMRWNSMEMG